MTHRVPAARLLAAACLLTLVACASDGDAPVRGRGRDLGGFSDGDGGVTGADTGPGIDLGFAECAATSVIAETTLRPLDIIVAIDNSGSMDEEARLVQENMNRFSSAIAASGLDYHVILLTAAGFVTVPPPLGGSANFMHVPQDVQSNNVMDILLSAFDAGYASFLRPTASTHFLVVTDDESDMAAATFISAMEAKLGHSFKYHSIASENASHAMCIPFFGCLGDEPGCTGPYGDAADIGRIHYEASAITGGLQFSICEMDWTAVFTSLTAAVAVPMPLPCVYLVPEPPAGMTFDRMRVNVVYTPGSGGAAPLPFVGTPTGGDCSRPGGGWYYDDPVAPTQILLCPTTCEPISADPTGRIDIALGCETFFG